MDIDMEVNGLAHELWAMSQSGTPIEDVIMSIMAELMTFAKIVQIEEREACAIVGGNEAEKCLNFPDGQRVADAIRARSEGETK